MRRSFPVRYNVVPPEPGLGGFFFLAFFILLDQNFGLHVWNTLLPV